MVERQPSKLNVVGSSPITCSNLETMMTDTVSGSLGPFETTKMSVISMVAKMQEAVVIQRLIDNPTETNLEILAQFILSDPQFLLKDEPPN